MNAADGNGPAKAPGLPVVAVVLGAAWLASQTHRHRRGRQRRFHRSQRVVELGFNRVAFTVKHLHPLAFGAEIRFLTARIGQHQLLGRACPCPVSRKRGGFFRALIPLIHDPRTVFLQEQRRLNAFTVGTRQYAAPALLHWL